MSQSLLEMFLAQGEAYEVAMNECKFLRFGENGLTSIGTANMGGCSAVIVVSNFGAILGHIAPLPDDHADNPNAGDEHAQSQMDQLEELFASNQHHFPPGTSGLVVSPMFEGQLALPHQQQIFNNTLEKLGLPISIMTYEVSAAGSPGEYSPGQGTVFIQGSGILPVVYAEDENVTVRDPAGESTFGDTITDLLTTGQGLSSGSSSASMTPHSPSTPTNDPNVSAFEASYYFIEHATYYYCVNRTSIELSPRPLRQWVYNEDGWSATNWVKKWRYWDGKELTYA